MAPARFGMWCAVLSAVVGLAVGPTEAEQKTPASALLVARARDGRAEPEARLAQELARRLIGARALFAAGQGRFVDAAGRDVPLKAVRLLWCHQGDAADAPGLLADKATAQALRRYVEAGRGLLLTGRAAAMVGPMGLDTVRTRPATFGHDRAQAGLVPLAMRHPAFDGAERDRGVLWMSNALFPAFAEFRPTSNPARGMVLARPAAGGNAMVEYAVGRGRVIALAWRLGPLYGRAAKAYRANFERLATNLARYLAAPSTWRPLTMDARGLPPRPAPEPRPTRAESQALARALRDLVSTFGRDYPRGAEWLARLAALTKARSDPARQAQVAAQFDGLRTEALLANPLMSFSRLLLIRRGEKRLGLPANYLSNSSLPRDGYDNEICVLSPVRPGGKRTVLFRPEAGRFVGDVDLHFDGKRMLMSLSDPKGRWGVWEVGADGSKPRRLPLIDAADVDNYDACYLPDGGIVFASTACFTGVPCVNGSGHVCNLYVRRPDGRVRQLTLEQDHNWCPAVLNNGRVLYLRWEYTDLPHAFSRILFHMNPDGTGQMEHYGSNSYWPASMFYARAIPNHPTKVVAVVGGHHEMPRMGDLVVFDPAISRFEADGAVCRVGSFGRKVTPALLDLPIAQSWPKFLHPLPLSEKYFLVSCKPSGGKPWGIYLADVFDNLVLLHEQAGSAMLEPIPLRPTPTPPVIPPRVDPSRKDAEVSITDIYVGPGLRGVPRGTIRSLRIVGYQFGYQGMGAEPYSIGLDGPWDPKRILGTVPVRPDGSARFRVPAYTPVSLQPLDAEGKAVQLMRSWLTAMPGEIVSCVGCHETQATSPAVRATLAGRREPDEIRPWYGPARGFSFRREVQPVLDTYCTGCHNGKPRGDGRAIPSFVDGPDVPTMKNKHFYNLTSRFSPSYYQLRRFVRTGTKESDLHLLGPWEFHADTTRLVQRLRRGHHNVRLPAEAWDRLITWIDLNAPAHGRWTDIRGAEMVRHQWRRRRAMRKRYAGMDDDPEADGPAANLGPPVVPPKTARPPARTPPCPGWPFDAKEAARRQRLAGAPSSLALKLPGGGTIEMVRIPAGEFLMGQADGRADEGPLRRVKIRRPFWMGRCEITNEQFARFDATHDSRIEHGDYIQFSPGERGWTLSRPTQPVVRVSWLRAMAFCRWLSRQVGRTVTLPTEAQWEYACRAGTASPLHYGATDSDFSALANLSDACHRAIDPFGWSGRPQVLPAWRPADARYADGSRVSAPVGSYRANAWGLRDMHGNVAEWTRSDYTHGSAAGARGRGPAGPATGKVVRGGSWYDPPARCRSAARQVYRRERPVFDVGFRVACEPAPTGRKR